MYGFTFRAKSLICIINLKSTIINQLKHLTTVSDYKTISLHNNQLIDKKITAINKLVIVPFKVTIKINLI